MDKKKSTGKQNPRNRSQKASKVTSDNIRLLKRALEIAEENQNVRDTLVE